MKPEQCCLTYIFDPLNWYFINRNLQTIAFILL